MKILRNGVDNLYDLIRPGIFYLTKNDPETAHELFVNFLRILHSTGLEKFVLDSEEEKNGIQISNAAGFNKNGHIPPTALKHLGFDRVVVGSMTGESYEENQRPRIIRFTDGKSLVNFMKLPGAGAEKVSKIMDGYGSHEVPITINIAPTPGKEGDLIFDDLQKSVRHTRDLPYVDRFELNISCPNTGDERAKYQEKLSRMLGAVLYCTNPRQKLYIKVSPDLTFHDIDDIISASLKFPINGFTIANTTTENDSKYISKSPGKGGASGDAVYEKSLEIQKIFYEKLRGRDDIKLIACGGIDSVEKMNQRLNYGAEEIQIFTPLIFEGPKLLRNLRNNLEKTLQSK